MSARVAHARTLIIVAAAADEAGRHGERDRLEVHAEPGAYDLVGCEVDEPPPLDDADDVGAGCRIDAVRGRSRAALQRSRCVDVGGDGERLGRHAARAAHLDPDAPAHE